MHWSKSFGWLGLWLLVQVTVPQALAQTSSPQSADSSKITEYLCPQALPKAIEAIIERPELARSRWGILIAHLDSEQVLYSLAADKYFTPASNTKLLTTAAALLTLGADFRIRTPVYATGKPPHLEALWLKGQGDATISLDSINNLVQKLQALGIRSIKNLIVDDSYFSSPKINPTWEWFDVYQYYATAISSVILNENTVTLTLLPQQLGQSLKLTWSDPIAARQWLIDNQTVTAPVGTANSIETEGVLGQPVLQLRGELAIDAKPDVWDLAIADPASYFLESWRYLLLSRNIKVAKAAVARQTPSTESAKEIAAIVSPPLSVLLTETNQDSNNLFAEALLQTLGKKLRVELPVEGVKQTLTQLGIKPQSYQLIDGSGLSRYNLISPQAIVQTLQLIAQTPQAEIYQSSLAVAGINGTLKRRFQNTIIAKNLQGKTGVLSGISALSGYLNLSTYQPLVFSIMVNNSDQSAATLRQAIDEIVILLGQLRRCNK